MTLDFIKLIMILIKLFSFGSIRIMQNFELPGGVMVRFLLELMPMLTKLMSGEVHEPPPPLPQRKNPMTGIWG